MTMTTMLAPSWFGDRTIVERHHVIAGVLWLEHTPVRSVEQVRCASDPEGIWITLRPGRDYGILDAESGHLYVAALVGTLVEVTYTLEQGSGALPDPQEHRAWTDVGASVQVLTGTRVNGRRQTHGTPVISSGHEPWLR
jgi:hypothetical protein